MTPLHLQLRSVLDAAMDASGLAARRADLVREPADAALRGQPARRAAGAQPARLEGRLSVRKGAGYFVNRRRVIKNLPVVTSPTRTGISGEPHSRRAAGVGLGPTLETRRATWGPAHRPRVHQVRGVGRIDGEPVALMTRAYPVALAKWSTAGWRPWAVHQALADHGLVPHQAEVVLAVAFASADGEELLEVPEGTSFV